ncbi:F-box domain [Cinara cedri]|uniref:F-box domain n=1 Tax=Cinara cedri TaxID=506608 RepID=A0A5E4MKL3_9HEMI|nr:F-box domain [Cinara cedri]
MLENQLDKSVLDLSQHQKSETKTCFGQLPLEIIGKIFKYLDEKDLNSIAHVSKIWRTIYLNQDTIWKQICINLNILKFDYDKLVTRYFGNKGEITHKNDFDISADIFGIMCKWWTLYRCYQMVIRNILSNKFIRVYFTNKQTQQTFCTDSYIISINRTKELSIHAWVLQNSTLPLKLKEFNLYKKLIQNENYNVKVVGNNTFLIFEIHSVIFVYKIKNGSFLLKYAKVIQKPKYNDKDSKFEMEPSEDFLQENQNTKIDLCQTKLLLAQPSTNKIFIIDLTSGKICNVIKYFLEKCIVDVIKFTVNRVMIGISVKDKIYDRIILHYAIIFFLEDDVVVKKVKILLYGTITKFKVSTKYIGVENKAQPTPFIIKKNKFVVLFWIDCDTFTIDSGMNRVAKDAISNQFPLTSINDRFILVQSKVPHSFEIFDTKLCVTVRSIQLLPGYKLAHVGKLSISFINEQKVLLIRFC